MNIELGIKKYCSIKEAVEWIAFGWPAFINSKDKLEFEKKNPFDENKFKEGIKKLHSSIKAGNIDVLGVYYYSLNYCWLILTLPLAILIGAFSGMIPFIRKQILSFDENIHLIDKLLPRFDCNYEYVFEVPFSVYHNMFVNNLTKKEKTEIKEIENRTIIKYNVWAAKSFKKKTNIDYKVVHSRKQIPNDRLFKLNYKRNCTTFLIPWQILFLDGYDKIEISTDDLMNVYPVNLNSNAQKSEIIDEGAYTTVYLEIMKSVIKDLNITKDNQPVKKELIYRISEEAKKRNIEVSDRKVEYLATFIRLPEMEEGGARKL